MFIGYWILRLLGELSIENIESIRIIENIDSIRSIENIRSIEIIGKLSIEVIRNIDYGEIAKIYITCIQLLLPSNISITIYDLAISTSVK